MSVNPSAVVEAFSITHAEVLDGSTSFVEAALGAQASADAWDVYGVNNASLDPSSDSYDNEGDNVVMSRWNWINNAEVSIQAGYMSFPLIATLTGQTISSGGTGSDKIYGLDLWHEDSMNVPDRPMILKMPSKDHLGNIRTLTFGLYRVSFNPITFDGPAYKDGLKVNYNGVALFSSVDEVGVAFPDGKKRIGRVLSHK
jgi:hypothetical protein